VFRKEDTIFRREHSVGWDHSPLRALRREEDAAILRSINSCAPVRLLEDTWTRPSLEADVTAPCLAVPICSASLGAVAIVLFGPHRNGDDIDKDECQLLTEFVTQAAAGYERVAFVQLRNKVTELQASLAALNAVT